MKPITGNKGIKIGGYVVYNRRKKRTANGESISRPSNAISSNSEASKEKVDEHAVTPPAPAVKEDECDDSGKLLCCKACSHTYHLQCLSPPVESMPDGDWRCRNCSDSDDLSEPIVNSDVSKNMLSPEKVNNACSSCSICSKAKKVINLSKDDSVRYKTSSTDESDASVEVDKSAIEYQGGVTVSDADNCSNIQRNPEKIEHDKLLILSEVVQDSIEELDKPEKNATTKQQLDPVCNQAGQPQKEKSAKPPAKKNEKKAMGNTSKGPLSSSRVTEPKKSSDLQIVKYDESVLLNAIPYNWKGADAQRSSFLSMFGQDNTIPDTPFHKKNVSASGFTSIPSFGQNKDTLTSGMPSGYLKRKEDVDDWSEMELDALWIGVRRYGQGNWEAIVQDPGMRLVSNKTAEEVSMRWKKEILKFFPSPTPTSIVLPTMTDRAMPYILDTSAYTDATTMQFPGRQVPPHLSGIQGFPLGVGSQSLLSGNIINPSLISGGFGSYNIGSSSRVSHPFEKVPSAPHLVSNISSMEPKVSELLLQALNQRANEEKNSRPKRSLQASQTGAAEAGPAKRIASSTSAEPSLLLGGRLRLPKAWVDKKAGDDRSTTKSNPSMKETDEESGWSSERTLSA